ECTLLQHPQELGLQCEGQVADFIEEQRPLMGQFKASEALREGPREGAFFVPEEFAFQEVRREGGAVDRDKGARAPRAEAVQGARQEFFARAGLALEEHGGISRRHAFELREHRRQRGAVPEDPLKAVLGVDDLAEYGAYPTASCSYLTHL